MIKNNFKIKLYNDMCLTRIVEEKIVSEYPKNEIRCPVHLSIGQEAISAGVSSLLINTIYLKYILTKNFV